MQAVLVFTGAPFVVTNKTRKINDRLRSERPPTDRSSQPVRKVIFAEKTNIQFVKRNENSVYYRNEVDSRGPFSKNLNKNGKDITKKKKFRFFHYVVHRWLCNNKNSHHTKQLHWKNVFGQNIVKRKYVSCFYHNYCKPIAVSYISC